VIISPSQKGNQRRTEKSKVESPKNTNFRNPKKRKNRGAKIRGSSFIAMAIEKKIPPQTLFF
jgi:hypothetical protein